MVGAGAAVFMIVTNPLVERLAKTVEDLQGALDEVKTLGGLLPIRRFPCNVMCDSRTNAHINLSAPNNGARYEAVK